MSNDFQDITVISNPEQAQVRDGSRRHAKKFPFRLSAATTPEWGLRCKDYFRARKSVECLSLSSDPEQRSDEGRLPSCITYG
jgi:hypothetical protein